MTWGLALPCAELGRGPVGVVLESGAWVLARDRQGKAWAVADRCPASGEPLSAGTVREGQIVCRCHGWSYGPAGLVRGRQRQSLPAVSVPVAAINELPPYLWLDADPRPGHYPDPLVSGPAHARTARRIVDRDPLDLAIDLLAHWLEGGTFQPTELVNVFSGEMLTRLRSGRVDLLVRPGALARVENVWPVARRATVAYFTARPQGGTCVDLMEATVGKQAWLVGWPRRPVLAPETWSAAAEVQRLARGLLGPHPKGDAEASPT